MVNAIDWYRYLMGQISASTCDVFDGHVTASACALVLSECVDASGLVVGLTEGLGLGTAQVLSLLEGRFPAFAERLQQTEERVEAPELPADEQHLQQLLFVHSTERTPFERAFSSIIARRAQQPRHLWQDLGLRNRRELSWLMERHFAPLSDRNSKDMKWKKFLYRMICRDSGFALCVAPSCEECSDYAACFGDEAGEGLIASHGSGSTDGLDEASNHPPS